MKIAISMPVYGQAHFTDSVLNQIASEAYVDAYVVDNAGDYRSAHDRVTVLQPGRNVGWLRGTNLGLSKALETGYDAYVLMNNDVTLSEAFFKHLYETTLKGAGIVGPLYDDVYPWQIRYRGSAADFEPQEGHTWAPMVDGTCLMVTHEALMRIGLLDEVFGQYGWGGDADFCIRARRLGYRVAVSHGAFLNHHKKQTALKVNPSYCRDAEIERSREMSRKYGPDWYRIQMGQVKSYDVFDTLIGRDVQHPHDVFSIVEARQKFPGFRDLRVAAERGADGTLDGIYRKFAEIAPTTPEVAAALKDAEIQAEHDVSVPIRSVMEQVRDGDILVSDMYLPPSVIRSLLARHGFVKDVAIYVTPSGKHTGAVYRELQTRYRIEQHVGDNPHSDIEMSRRFGIPSVHVTVSELTEMEKFLLPHARETAMLMRRFRLACRTDDAFWYEQSQFNCPLLLYAAVRIRDLMRRERYGAVAFLTRDCCLLQRLFAKLYPDVTVKTLHSSRVVNRFASPQYRDYLRGVCDPDTLLVDFHGALTSGRELYRSVLGRLPRIHILFPMHQPNPFPTLSYEFDVVTNFWETLNYDTVGCLVDYDGEPVRAPNENDGAKCRALQTAFGEFLPLASLAVEAELLATPPDLWRNFIRLALARSRQKSLMGGEPTEHRSLRELANQFGSDKGDQYKCAHHYTRHYAKIIQKLLERFPTETLTLFEIGLNRDGPVGVPSLEMFRAYFKGNINLIGFDVDERFRKFAVLGSIVIGDQANPRDLERVTTSHHIVIDDGYHASRHQQVSLAALWRTVRPGGCYVIEDLHYQPEPEPDDVKTKHVLQQWRLGNFVETRYLRRQDVPGLVAIEFFDSASKNFPAQDLEGAMVVLWKHTGEQYDEC